MVGTRMIMSITDADPRYPESILRELRRAGIDPTFVPAASLPKSEIPHWVSAGGAGVAYYLAVPEAQAYDAAGIAMSLRRCQSCGAYFLDKHDHCSECGAEYVGPPDPKDMCRSCGCDLRATPGRCPECGTVPASKEA